MTTYKIWFENGHTMLVNANWTGQARRIAMELYPGHGIIRTKRQS